MALISSASNTGSNIEFIRSGKSFIYMLRTIETLELILGETKCSNVSQSEKTF